MHSFTDTDGKNPTANLVNSGNTLYGVTGNGGTFGRGVLFAVNTDGSSYTVLKGFTQKDGIAPGALLLSGTELYGSTAWGGSSDRGTLFKVNLETAGYQMLKQFSETDGVEPYGRLVISGLTLFGTTYGGGISNRGTIFRINMDGSGYAILKEFVGADGAFPAAGLELAGTTLYGATGGDGSLSYGNVFRVNLDGSGFGVLTNFSRSYGGGPSAGLRLADARLFGTLPYGGISNNGVVFQINTDGSGFAELHDFGSGSEGAQPQGSLVVSGTKLYGLTQTGGSSGKGVVFQLNTNGSDFSVLKTFSGGSDGAYPSGDLALFGTGLYGGTSSGGDGGGGIIFGLALPSVAPMIVAPPSSQIVVAGSNISFTVHASGLPILAYRWMLNETNPIADATAPTLLLTNVLASQAGYYIVTVTNDHGAVTSSPAALEVLLPGPVTLTNYTAAALEAALAAGGPVTLAGDGTIQLDSSLTIVQDATIDASGHAVTITGGLNCRAFEVKSNATLRLIHLTVANGGATNGGAIFIDGGTVELSAVAFLANTVVDPGSSGGGQGGAIFNRGGTVNATNCTFSDNSSGSLQGSALGGAICNQGGQILLENCVLTGNSVAGAAEKGGGGCGGAIHNVGGLAINRCYFFQNTALGGSGVTGGSLWPGIIPGGPGGAGQGGAICSLAAMTLDSSLFLSNTAAGGAGGQGGPAYAPLPDFGWPAGPGGPGGGGYGGAVFNGGTATVVNCTVAWNSGYGGQGGPGGAPLQNEPGGQGGSGGNAVGGISDTNGVMDLTNCTIAFCSGTGGVIGLNQGLMGIPGTNGIGIGGIQAAGSWLVNTLLATNAPGNCSGTLTDAGHNLSSDSSCVFGGDSQNSTDPKLAPLGDYGGPTLTIGLLPGSPAIDRGNTLAAPVMDQRGFPRPVGPAADIGAFEFGSPAFLRLAHASNGLDIFVTTLPSQTCRLLCSSNLVNWVSVATNQTDAAGALVFHEDQTSALKSFYRLVLP